MTDIVKSDEFSPLEQFPQSAGVHAAWQPYRPHSPRRPHRPSFSSCGTHQTRNMSKLAQFASRRARRAISRVYPMCLTEGASCSVGLAAPSQESFAQPERTVANPGLPERALLGTRLQTGLERATKRWAALRGWRMANMHNTQGPERGSKTPPRARLLLWLPRPRRRAVSHDPTSTFVSSVRSAVAIW